jgi:hypothetical protein
MLSFVQQLVNKSIKWWQISLGVIDRIEIHNLKVGH